MVSALLGGGGEASRRATWARRSSSLKDQGENRIVESLSQYSAGCSKDAHSSNSRCSLVLCRFEEDDLAELVPAGDDGRLLLVVALLPSEAGFEFMVNVQFELLVRRLLLAVHEGG